MCNKEDKPFGQKVVEGVVIYTVAHLIFGPVGGVIATILTGSDSGDS